MRMVFDVFDTGEPRMPDVQCSVDAHEWIYKRSADNSRSSSEMSSVSSVSSGRRAEQTEGLVGEQDDEFDWGNSTSPLESELARAKSEFEELNRMSYLTDIPAELDSAILSPAALHVIGSFRSPSPNGVNSSRTADQTEELVGGLEGDPENLREMLHQVKSRVVELEAELSDAAIRSSRELEEHVKLFATVLKDSLESKRALLYELESKLEDQAEPSALLEQAQQKVVLLERSLQESRRSAANDKGMVIEAQRVVQEISESATKDKTLLAETQKRLEQSQNEAHLREAAIKIIDDMRQAAVERRSASSTLVTIWRQWY